MEKKKLLITIITIYIIVSFLEWYIHRFLMHYTDNKVINFINYFFKKIYHGIHGHSQDNSHVQHHTVVLNNGDVDEDDDGMFFNSKNIPLVTLSCFSIYYLISRIFQYNHSRNEYIIILLVSTIISFLYYKLWNILHPSYHNYHTNNYIFIKNNPIYKYLKNYHMIHHLNKGKDKCNFNIVLPGADFILGTYRGCIDNKEFCEKNDKKTEKEEELCENQKNGTLFEDGLKFCN